jgi:hypothetical protein
MIPDSDVRRLQDAYRREQRSLLQYTREAAPYAGPADRPLRDGILRIANEESVDLDAFGKRMEAHRVPIPYLGSFPVAFTDLNFTTARHFLPKLIGEQKRDILRLEADVPLCSDAVSQAMIQRLVEVHQRHLKELESLVQ